jgi:autotransporter-associated beta strand protein
VQSVRRRSAAAGLSAAAFAALVAGRTRGANYFWDPNASVTGGGSGGSGTWDIGTPEWFLTGATTDVAWPNTNANVAEFNGTAGIVSLGTNITTLGLKFDVSGYALNTGSSALALFGSGIAVAAGDVANINGTIQASSGSQTWSAGAGATLNFNGTYYNASNTLYDSLSTTGGGTINISGGTATAPVLVTGAFTAGAGTVNIGGVFNTSSANANNTKFDINGGGVVNWNATGTQAGGYTGIGDGTNGFLNINGGTMTVSPTLGMFVANGNVSSGVPALAVLNVSGGNLVVTTNANIYVGDSYSGGAGGTGNGTINVNVGNLSTGTTTGSFILGGTTNTGTGTINLNLGGTLATGRTISAGAFPKGTFNFNGGTLQASSGTMAMSALVNAVILDGGAVIDTNGFAGTIASNISSGGTGIGGLTKLGVGVLTLSGTNSYAGGTNVSAGTLAVAAPFSLPGFSTPGKVTVGSGAFLSLGYNGSAGFAASDIATVQANATFVAGSGLGLDVSSATPVTYANNLGGFTNFIKTNTGTLTLAGTNTYAGTTTAAAGYLAEPSVAAFGTTSGLVLGSGSSGGGYSSIGAGETIALPITLGGTTGGGVIDASGTGAVIVNGSVTVANVGAKTLTLQGTGAATNTLASTIGNGPGTLALAKSGADTWVVSGSNTYTGGTTLTAGYLRPTNPAAFGTGPVQINGTQTTNASNGGTLLLTGGLTVPNAINVQARYDPSISAPATTPHVENVSGNNTLSGNLTDTGAGGAGIVVQSDAGTLTIAGAINNSSGSAYNRQVYFTGAGNFVTAGPFLQNTAISGIILAKEGTGTLAVNGAGSNYSGGSFIYGGTVQANATAALGAALTTINQSGGVLAGTGTTGGPVSILAGGVITAGSGATAADTIGTLGAGTLNVSGGQYTVKLNGANSALAAAGTGASGAAGTVNDQLALGGLTFNASSTLMVSPAPLTSPGSTGSYSYLVATGPAGTFGSASTVLAGLTVSQTAPGVGTYALSTDAAGDSLFLDLADTAAAPEPTSLLLAGVAAAPLIIGRRRRTARRA